jgi:POT family proton-dependent oligopeptide transporter
MPDPQSITRQPDDITTPPAAALAITQARLDQPLSPEGYRTVPDQTSTGWPAGVPYIVGNEVCERFSFYGMKAILMVHLIALYTAAAYAEASAQARGTLHLFIAGVYALPMIGAIIADRLAGKYRTILYLSLFYCAGHAALSIWESNLSGVYLGLALIALGSGGIKPCVSANVGDQFGKANWFRVRTVYQVFYFSVNFGSFFATLLIPRMKESWGPSLARSLPGVTEHLTPEAFGTSLAFAIPGVLMFVATFIFWLGRRKFVHVPPSPGGKLGLLDTLSSTCLFLAVGHLFFTAGAASWFPTDWPRALALTAAGAVWVLLSGAFLVAGLALFAVRQRIAPDDGFLAIMFYTLGRYFRGERVEDDTPRRSVNVGTDGAADMGWLEHSRFWGPAVERYGQSAAEGPLAVLKIISVFFLISVFWALFDQHASSWIEQAKLMDLSLGDGKVLPNEIQALNPLLVMVLIPLLNLAYLACDRLGLRPLPLRRITVGMFITAGAFVAVALIQHRIDSVGAGQVWFVWQVIAYVLLTVGEVMVAITALEFAYTQAPRRMKSTIMSFLNLTIAVGNILVALLSYFSGLKLAPFFWVFAVLMACAGVLFGLRAAFYVQKDYPQ